MDDMQVVLVLLMAMQCDGATMVTITTLVSSHTRTHRRGTWKEGQWWNETTSQHHHVVVGWCGS